MADDPRKVTIGDNCGGNRGIREKEMIDVLTIERFDNFRLARPD